MRLSWIPIGFQLREAMRRNLCLKVSSPKRIVAALPLLFILAVVFVYARSRKETPQPQSTKIDSCEAFNKLPLCPYRWIRYGHFRLSSICWSEGCRSEYARHLQKQDRQPPIPAIRHIQWRNENVSANFVRHLRSWQKIHPNWTYVLWRDEDMEPFVAAHFPDMVPKFRCLPERALKVDLIRHMLLYKYGGVYADLDYTLVRGLDQFRSHYAVLTQEPEAHSLQLLGMTWPTKMLVSPAFMMSAPGHAFFKYVVKYLGPRRADKGALNYAGALGLTEIMEKFRKQCPVGDHLRGVVVVPPSYSFFPYRDNRLDSGGSGRIPERLDALRDRCNGLLSSNKTEQQLQKHHPLRQFCTDVNNMDSITDKSQPVFAIHDVDKPGSSYDGVGTPYFLDKPTDIRRVLKNVKFGREVI